jgi:hypothetical protein
MEEPTSNSFLADLNSFYQNYLVETPSGFLQIFNSFTYGEMVISFLLLVLVLLFTFKWFWEVLR